MAIKVAIDCRLVDCFFVFLARVDFIDDESGRVTSDGFEDEKGDADEKKFFPNLFILMHSRDDMVKRVENEIKHQVHKL